MHEHIDPVVNQAVEAIALGDDRPDPDSDLRIVDAHPFGAGHNRRGELSRIRRSLWNIGRPVDLVLFFADETREWAGSPNHLIGRSLREQSRFAMFILASAL